MDSFTKASRSLTIIGTAALLWNMIGDASFIGQYVMDRPDLAQTDPDSAHLFAQTPGWVWAIFALSVSTATAGSVLLLLRRAAAAPLYHLSTSLTLILFGHSFLATDMLALKGWGSIALPALILTLGVAQLLYARAMRAKGVLR